MTEKDIVNAIDDLSSEVQGIKKDLEEIKVMIQEVANKLEDDEE